MSTDRATSTELKDTGYEIFVGALSVLSIVNLVLLYVVSDEALDYVLRTINGILSVILFLDFCYRLYSARSRSQYFWREFGWADLLASLPLSQLKVLRIFRLARVFRLLREFGARSIILTLVRNRAGSALLTLLLIAILVMEFGSLLMLRVESASPDANIRTASDALWYLIVTMSTVGYGDRYPVTNPGRTIGSLVIVIGVGIFGTLTGYLANAFLASPKEAEPGTEDFGEAGALEQARAAEPTGSRELAVTQQLEALRDQHRAALTTIEQLLAAPSGRTTQEAP